MCTAKPYAKATPDTLKDLYFGWLTCGCDVCQARLYVEQKRLASFGHDVYNGSHRGVAKENWWTFPGYKSFDRPQLDVSNHLRALRGLQGLGPYGDAPLKLLEARQTNSLCAAVQRRLKRQRSRHPRKVGG